ncbi:hypothetical protein VCRA2113O202_140076 [Vibrio crassostreae]|nr:hypothetical protein VCRA2113O231_110106 [Vibrio crassostreae]CAK1764116.1 hypothetical protein VCRA2113O202_140076 [Vibrio crassostreae]
MTAFTVESKSVEFTQITCMDMSADTVERTFMYPPKRQNAHQNKILST